MKEGRGGGAGRKIQVFTSKELQERHSTYKKADQGGTTMDMELLEELKEKVPLLEVIGKKAEGMDQNFSLINKMD